MAEGSNGSARVSARLFPRPLPLLPPLTTRMDCPKCGIWKPRKAWTDSQNAHERTTRANSRGQVMFDGCRDCYAKASRIRTPTPERWKLRDASGAVGLQLSDRVDTVRPEGSLEADIGVLAGLLQTTWDQRIEEFVDRWMELPERSRKMWSTLGALFSRGESDPVSDIPTGTFDPGNWCYKKVMSMLCPRLVGGLDRTHMASPEATWGGATQGGICEAIMGAFFCAEEEIAEVEQVPRVTTVPGHLQARLPVMAKLAEKATYMTYRIMEVTPDYGDGNLRRAVELARQGPVAAVAPPPPTESTHDRPPEGHPVEDPQAAAYWRRGRSWWQAERDDRWVEGVSQTWPNASDGWTWTGHNGRWQKAAPGDDGWHQYGRAGAARETADQDTRYVLACILVGQEAIHKDYGETARRQLMHRVDRCLGKCQTGDIGTAMPLQVQRLRRVFEQELDGPPTSGERKAAWSSSDNYEC
ncbi:hypothetical protein N9L68_06150 [bacterium]|nr:hypothetical protein [bacterium]